MMDSLQINYDEIVLRVVANHKDKISQFKALKNELSIYFDELESSRIARQKMKEINPNTITREVLSVKAMQEKIKNCYSSFCEGNHFVEQSLNDLCIYFKTFYYAQHTQTISKDVTKYLHPYQFIDRFYHRMQSLQNVEDNQLIQEFLKYQLFKHRIIKMISPATYQYKNEFLRACVNFKSLKENLLLFINGYIRDTKIYFPMDVAQFCINYCYKFDYDLLEFKDKWQINPKYNKLEYTDTTEVNGEANITSKHIRKVWKMKVVKTHSENGLFTFKIGVKCGYTYYTISMREKIFKRGDIISMLLINYGNYGLLEFGINDIILNNRTRIISVPSFSFYSGSQCKLTLITTESEEVELLQ